jgi:hypothetical protein
MITCVFVSGTFGLREYQTTKNAIYTCREHTPGVQIIVVETYNETIKYDCDILIKNSNPNFNYNECLNLATPYAKHKYIGYFNNDVTFSPNWAQNIISNMERAKVLSASPFSAITQHAQKVRQNSGLYYGYRIGIELCGWAIVVNKDIWNTLGAFETVCSFWYSDDVYAHQLKENDIKHFIDTSSHVLHVHGGSQTLNGRGLIKRIELTHKQEKEYKKWLRENSRKR